MQTLRVLDSHALVAVTGGAAPHEAKSQAAVDAQVDYCRSKHVAPTFDFSQGKWVSSAGWYLDRSPYEQCLAGGERLMKLDE